MTVEYFDFESSWNLENLELECGPAQPDLLYLNCVRHLLVQTRLISIESQPKKIVVVVVVVIGVAVVVHVIVVVIPVVDTSNIPFKFG